MSYYSRNKNELLALVGAIYSFVAYLTAFALEVLFIIDLMKRQQQQQHSLPAEYYFSARGISRLAAPAELASSLQAPAPNDDSLASMSKLADSSAAHHLLVMCVAISIVYFIVFVASLVLIVALILRSCVCILIWLCIAATLLLPELGLCVYSSVFGWSLDSRYGKLELSFYALRALLNVIFMHRAHKLYKEWHSEKHFFRLKCAASRVMAGYDSPFFVRGADSLSTTINPVFAASANFDSQPPSAYYLSPSPDLRAGSRAYAGIGAGANKSLTRYLAQDTSDASFYSASQFDHQHHASANLLSLSSPVQRFYDTSGCTNASAAADHRRQLHELSNRHSTHSNLASYIPSAGNEQAFKASHSSPAAHNQACGPARCGSSYSSSQHYSNHSNHLLHHPYRRSNNSSYNCHNHSYRPRADDDDDNYFCPNELEMNLDYRTLTRPTSNNTLAKNIAAASQLSLSTRSLDRRNPSETDASQVVLRPIGHKPFEYLHRPGSTPGDLCKLDRICSRPLSSALSSLSNRSTTKLHL